MRHIKKGSDPFAARGSDPFFKDVGKRRVVIVGGGLAGLSAAESIARVCPERFDVTLLESRRVTGGRAGSFVDRASGESVDYCQHVAMGCCTNLIGLLDRAGQLADWTRYSQLTFLHPDAPPSHFSPSGFLPPPLHLIRTIGQLRYLSPTSRRQIQRGLFRLMRTPSVALRDCRARDWLRTHGQDESTIDAFWDVVLVSALGEQTSRVSMAAARKVLIDGFAAARGASDVLVPRKPLTNLFGESLAQYIQRLGVSIRTGVSASRLVTSMTLGPVESVETASGELIPADHVILAVPWPATARLIRASGLTESFPTMDQIAALPASPITGIHLWLDREVMLEPHATLVGMMPQWIFRQPIDTRKTDNEHYYQVVISASQDIRGIPQQDLIARVMEDLGRVLPKATQAMVLRAKVVTDPQSVFSLTPEVNKIRPSSTTPVEGLHLAGDWIQTGWPATMEGAVISGVLAANSVLTSEGESGLGADQGLPRNFLARSVIRD